MPSQTPSSDSIVHEETKTSYVQLFCRLGERIFPANEPSRTDAWHQLAKLCDDHARRAAHVQLLRFQYIRRAISVTRARKIVSNHMP